MLISLYEISGDRRKETRVFSFISFFMSIGLTIVAIIPAVILAAILGNEQ